MSLISQFGPDSTTLITNYCSPGSVSLTGLNTSNAARAVLSGALTANTLATALSVTGRGNVPFLAVFAGNTASRTIRCRVTVDGVVVFDATSNSITTTGRGLLIAGAYAASDPGGNNHWDAGFPITFNASLLVEIASSLTETDNLTTAYTLHSR